MFIRYASGGANAPAEPVLLKTYNLSRYPTYTNKIEQRKENREISTHNLSEQ